MTRLAGFTAIVLGIATLTGTARAEDLDNGKSQFNKCKSCHDVGENAKNKIGPPLNNIIDRKAASIDGFNYSDSIKGLAAKGLVWNVEMLSKYIDDPKSVVPNGKMVFAGLKDQDDRNDLIAYLKQFSKK